MSSSNEQVRYIPVESPCYSKCEHGTLPEVLNDDTEAIVVDPTFGHGLSKRNAKASGKHQSSIRESECDGVARNHGCKLEVEG